MKTTTPTILMKPPNKCFYNINHTLALELRSITFSRTHVSRKPLVQFWMNISVCAFLSCMGVALQGIVSKLPESINMNNGCKPKLLLVRAYFVPAPTAPACSSV